MATCSTCHLPECDCKVAPETAPAIKRRKLVAASNEPTSVGPTAAALKAYKVTAEQGVTSAALTSSLPASIFSVPIAHLRQVESDQVEAKGLEKLDNVTMEEMITLGSDLSEGIAAQHSLFQQYLVGSFWMGYVCRNLTAIAKSRKADAAAFKATRIIAQLESPGLSKGGKAKLGLTMRFWFSTVAPAGGSASSAGGA